MLRGRGLGGAGELTSSISTVISRYRRTILYWSISSQCSRTLASLPARLKPSTKAWNQVTLEAIGREFSMEPQKPHRLWHQAGLSRRPALSLALGQLGNLSGGLFTRLESGGSTAGTHLIHGKDPITYVKLSASCMITPQHSTSIGSKV